MILLDTDIFVDILRHYKPALDWYNLSGKSVQSVGINLSMNCKSPESKLKKKHRWIKN
ncbi:MAG: hypothetical protein HW421_1089 [Ignavibacteria bacterium]|nr:hypothetical protein [Ignavibacteria bacterium]